MPWKCPVCHHQIAHSELEARPRPNTPYSCHICGAELIVDWDTNRLAVAPVAAADNQGLRPGRGQSGEAT